MQPKLSCDQIVDLGKERCREYKYLMGLSAEILGSLNQFLGWVGWGWTIRIGLGWAIMIYLGRRGAGGLRDMRLFCFDSTVFGQILSITDVKMLCVEMFQYCRNFCHAQFQLASPVLLPPTPTPTPPRKVEILIEIDYIWSIDSLGMV